MRLPDVFGTTAFRWTLAVSGGYVAITVLLWAFIYWQSALFEQGRLNSSVTMAGAFLAHGPSASLTERVDAWMALDLHRQKFAGVFTRDGTLAAGNILAAPADLPLDHRIHRIHIVWHGPNGLRPDVIHAVGYRMADGDELVVGRDIDTLVAFRLIILRALGIGLAPALLLSLAVGTALSLRAQRRIRSVHKAAERIMHGHLQDRLPAPDAPQDDLDKVAAIVNRMLDRITDLIGDLRNVGDNIAHDLRTPLTRVMTRLERSRDSDETKAQFQESIDSAMSWIDQTLAIITALLRISEIEYGRRQSHFGPVCLSETLDSVCELYEPIAQERGVRFEVRAKQGACVSGDRELLFEALANLVDNAIKFAPEGGNVSVTLAAEGTDAVIEVRDDGPGIPAAERGAVMRRFYRADKSRHIAGNGLGLSLVNAIMTLHGGTFVIDDVETGCRVRLRCAAQPRDTVTP